MILRNCDKLAGEIRTNPGYPCIPIAQETNFSVWIIPEVNPEDGIDPSFVPGAYHLYIPRNIIGKVNAKVEKFQTGQAIQLEFRIPYEPVSGFQVSSKIC